MDARRPLQLTLGSLFLLIALVAFRGLALPSNVFLADGLIPFMFLLSIGAALRWTSNPTPPPAEAHRPLQFGLASVFVVATLCAAATRLLWKTPNHLETALITWVLIQAGISWPVLRRNSASSAHRRPGPLAAILLANLIMLVGYVAGYFVLGTSWTKPPLTCRNFSYPWMCEMYRPAAMTEARLGGDCVVLCYRSGSGYSPYQIHSLVDYLD